METSRAHLIVQGGVFTNVYTSTSIPVGTKIAIQNLSSDTLIVYIGNSPTASKGWVIPPYEYFYVSAQVEGCFLMPYSNESAVVAIERGGNGMASSPIDERVYDGLKAFTVQSFTEANSKNGTQWSISTRNIAVPASGTLDVLMTTGSLPVLMKGLVVQYTGSQIETVLYKNSVVTGGDTVNSYNLNTYTGGAMLSTFKVNNPAGFTIIGVGTQVAPSEHFYGIADQGNKSIPSFIATGLERVLAPNTTYLRRVWNRGSGTCVIDLAASFYEGEISSQN